MYIAFGVLAVLVPVIILALIVWGIAALMTKQKTADNTPSKPQAVDVMYYIGMFIALSTSVGALVGLIFAAIEHRFKDVLEISQYYNELQVGEDVRMSVAMIFVVFPIYIVLAWLTSKRIHEDLDRASLLVRKIYTYGIILITSLTLAGTLVSIIYNYLSGELFVRFGPKALSLIVIASAVLGYHIYNLRRNYSVVTKVPLVMAICASLFVATSVVLSIAETGSPSHIRKVRFDDKRLVDLSNIQSQILSKWQQTGVLPENLASLNNEVGGNIVPVDPKTKKAYEYKVITNSTLVEEESSQFGNVVSKKKKATTPAVFEICATFETVRDVAKRTGQDEYGYKGGVTNSSYPSSYRLDYSYYTNDSSNPTWDHGAERTCYTRTINPDQYQIYGY